MSQTLSKEQAIQDAQYEIRFNVGTLPYLSDPVEMQDTYYFLIQYTPVTIDPSFTEKDILFYPTQTIGVLWFDENGEICRTDDETLNTNIRIAREKVDAGKLKSLCYEELVEEGIAEERFTE